MDKLPNGVIDNEEDPVVLYDSDWIDNEGENWELDKEEENTQEEQQEADQEKDNTVEKEDETGEDKPVEEETKSLQEHSEEAAEEEEEGERDECPEESGWREADTPGDEEWFTQEEIEPIGHAEEPLEEAAGGVEPDYGDDFEENELDYSVADPDDYQECDDESYEQDLHERIESQLFIRGQNCLDYYPDDEFEEFEPSNYYDDSNRNDQPQPDDQQ